MKKKKSKKKFQGRDIPKRKGTFGNTEKPENKDTYNRADASLANMIGNKGIPRQKVGLK